MTTRSLERPERRWEGNAKINLKEMRYSRIVWIRLVYERDKLAGFCEYGNGTSGSTKREKSGQ